MARYHAIIGRIWRGRGVEDGGDCSYPGGGGDEDWGHGAGLVRRAQVAMADGGLGGVYAGDLPLFCTLLQRSGRLSRSGRLYAGAGEDAVSIPSVDDVRVPFIDTPACDDGASAACGTYARSGSV